MGLNNPVTSWFSVGGVKRASETPGAGTCNGSGVYTGVVKDESADGYCAAVWWEDAGVGWDLAGRVCGVGKTATFGWDDDDGNDSALVQFCIDKASDPTDAAVCGWATQVGASGPILRRKLGLLIRQQPSPGRHQ
jgi:hypothetical protein